MSTADLDYGGWDSNSVPPDYKLVSIEEFFIIIWWNFFTTFFSLAYDNTSLCVRLELRTSKRERIKNPTKIYCSLGGILSFLGRTSFPFSFLGRVLYIVREMYSFLSFFVKNDHHYKQTLQIDIPFQHISQSFSILSISF